MDRAERDRKIYQEWLGGAPIRDIAARWGIEKSTVKQIVARPDFFCKSASTRETNIVYDARSVAPVPQDEKIS